MKADRKLDVGQQRDAIKEFEVGLSLGSCPVTVSISGEPPRTWILHKGLSRDQNVLPIQHAMSILKMVYYPWWFAST